MNNLTGKLLFSTLLLEDPNFEKVVIYITEHNENGAMGFVINKLFSRALNELVEFNNSLPFPLYQGGPVEKEKIYFIHRCPDLILDAKLISDSVYFGGNFKQAITLLNNTTITQNDIKLFIGYCGWDPNQLEEEIKEGSWEINDGNTQAVFSQYI